jgi:hypothetical protein
VKFRLYVISFWILFTLLHKLSKLNVIYLENQNLSAVVCCYDFFIGFLLLSSRGELVWPGLPQFQGYCNSPAEIYPKEFFAFEFSDWFQLYQNIPCWQNWPFPKFGSLVYCKVFHSCDTRNTNVISKFINKRGWLIKVINKILHPFWDIAKKISNGIKERGLLPVPNHCPIYGKIIFDIKWVDTTFYRDMLNTALGFSF